MPIADPMLKLVKKKITHKAKEFSWLPLIRSTFMIMLYDYSPAINFNMSLNKALYVF